MLAVLVLVLTACDNNTSNSSPDKPVAVGASDIAIDSTGKHVYVLNSNSDNISHYSILPDGKLELVSIKSFFSGLVLLESIAAHPTQGFVYVLEHYGHGITQLEVGANGELSLNRAGASVAAGVNPQSMTIHPSGNYAYVVNGGDGNPSTVETDILLYSIESNGNLLLNDSVPILDVGPGLERITFTPNGNFAFTENTYWASISQLTVGVNGELSSNIVPKISLNTPISIVVHPSGKYAYVASDFLGTGFDAIMQYVIDTGGGLTPNPVSPSLSPSSNAQVIAMHPSGNFLYFIRSNLQVAQYVVQADGTLAANPNATMVYSGSSPVRAIVHPSGNYLYIVCYSDSGHPVHQYAIAQDGSLSEI
jgi:6-phosphogluconolactonase (cycloisomerase 2 family)